MNKKQKLLYGLVLIIALFLGFYIKEKREEKNRVALEQSIKSAEELQLPAAETKTAKEWLELGDKFFKEKEALSAGEAYYKGLQVVKDPYERSVLVDSISYVSTDDGTIELLEGEVKANTKYSYIYITLILAYSKYGGTFEQIKETYDKGIASLENNDRLSKEEKEEVEYLLNMNMADHATRYSKFELAYELSKKTIKMQKKAYKELAPDKWWYAYHYLGISCIGLKKYDEALEHFKYIYDDLNIKNDAEIINGIGISYFYKNDLVNARKYIEQAVKLGSKDAKNNLKKLEKKENSKTK